MSQPGARYTVVDELLERVIRSMDAITRQISISLQQRRECYEAHLLEINRREQAVRNLLGMEVNNSANLPNNVNVDNRNNRTYTINEQRGLNPNATYTIPRGNDATYPIPRGNDATYTIPRGNDATYTIPRFNDTTYTVDRGGHYNLFGREDTNPTIRTNPLIHSTSTGGYPTSHMSSDPERQSTQLGTSYLDSMQTQGFGSGIDSSLCSSSFKTSPTPNSTFSSGFTNLDVPNSSARSGGLTTDIPSTNSTLYETHLRFPMDYTTTSSNNTSGGDFSSVTTNGWSSADKNRFQTGVRIPSPTTTSFGSSVSPRTMTTPEGSSFLRNAYDGPVIPLEFYDSNSSGNSNNLMSQLDSALSQANATTDTNISSGTSSNICIIHCPHCGSVVRIRANRSHGVICSQKATSGPLTSGSSGTPGQSSQSQWSSTTNPNTSGLSSTPRQNNHSGSSNTTSNYGLEESRYTANGGGQTFRPVVNYSICEPNLPELIKRPNFINQSNSKAIVQSEQLFRDAEWDSKMAMSRKRNAGKVTRSSKNRNTGVTKRTKPNVPKKETASLKIKQIQENLHSSFLDNNNVKKESKRNGLNVCTNDKIRGSLPKGIPSKGGSIKMKSSTSVQSETFSYSSDRDHEFPSNSDPSLKYPFSNLVRSQKNILFSKKSSDLDHLVGSTENLTCKSAAGNENKFAIRRERFSPTYTDEVDELDENSNSLSSWTGKMYDLLRRIQS